MNNVWGDGMNQQLTSRERVLLGLQHKETDRVPFGLGFGVNLPARVKLMEYLGMRDMEQVDSYLKSFADIRGINADYIGPADRNLTLENGDTVDVWGVRRKNVSYGDGHYDEISCYPLADITGIKQLDDFRWPSPEWWDAENFKDKIKSIDKEHKYAISLGNGNIYESSWYMRGFEQMFIDMAENPELAFEIMTRVTDYFIAYFRRLLDAADGLIDIAFTADDLGGQQGLLMSPSMWEEMIKPHHMRLNKVLHEYGVKIMYHTDGAVMKVVPGLMDMGIDILEALQFSAADMDPVFLKENYGDKLCFHGGVSVQSTLPFGTKGDVVQEVKERIDVLGRDGGYILAPSHAIQAGTPPENIAAFLETGHNYYPFK